MAPPGVVHPVGGQAPHVVGAQHGTVEHPADQDVVLHAGGLLDGGAAGPDRLLDDRDPAAGVRGDERQQQPGQDPPGVATGDRHVGVADRVTEVGERVLQGDEVLARDGDQHGLARRHRGTGERRRTPKVVVGVPVEQRWMVRHSTITPPPTDPPQT